MLTKTRGRPRATVQAFILMTPAASAVSITPTRGTARFRIGATSRRPTFLRARRVAIRAAHKPEASSRRSTKTCPRVRATTKERPAARASSRGGAAPASTRAVRAMATCARVASSAGSARSCRRVLPCAVHRRAWGLPVTAVLSRAARPRSAAAASVERCALPRAIAPRAHVASVRSAFRRTTAQVLPSVPRPAPASANEPGRSARAKLGVALSACWHIEAYRFRAHPNIQPDLPPIFLARKAPANAPYEASRR